MERESRLYEHLVDKVCQNKLQRKDIADPGRAQYLLKLDKVKNNQLKPTTQM